MAPDDLPGQAAQHTLAAKVLATPPARLQIGLHEVGGHTLRVGVRPGDTARPPLLLFNAIGANIELVEPFLDALEGPAAIVFDVPGVGGSPRRRCRTVRRRWRGSARACSTSSGTTGRMCWAFPGAGRSRRPRRAIS